MQSLKSGKNFKLNERVKRYRRKLKYNTMMAFGGRCVHPRCDKNADENLDELHLIHPNQDGNEHRTLISKGYMASLFYSALKKRGWNTDGFKVVVMCKSHHNVLDKSGENAPWFGKNRSEETKMKIASTLSQRTGEDNNNWKGDSASVAAKYQRHRRRPDLYPPLTEQEKDEHGLFIKEYYREYRRRKRNNAILVRQ